MNRTRTAELLVSALVRQPKNDFRKMNLDSNRLRRGSSASAARF